jgi:predicted nucleic acid-binding protein
LSLQIILHIQQHVDDRYDYTQRAGAQFILLKNLCNEAKRTIRNSLEQFLNQTFISSQVISEEIFNEQANVLIQEWQIFTANSFLRTLHLIEEIHYGNHLAARSSNSNFDLNIMPNTFVLNSLVYYNQCNCMLSPLCHAPMRLYPSLHDNLNKFDVPGFFVGCFPLKALLQSTLECFYNQTCIDTLKKLTSFYPDAIVDLTPLNVTRNFPNETIDSIVKKSFVDDWSQSISFDKYFTTCAPKLCTYEHIGRRNLMFLITSVISIYGGLSTGLQISFIVLLWIIMKVRHFIITFH